MSACAIKHWGTGTPCVKESNTTAAKEMAAKLAQMKAEREKQDTMWQQPTYTSAAETHPYQASSSRTNQRGTF
jgi:hypothetical protein